MDEAKRKHWNEVWAASIGNRPQWAVFVTRTESVLAMRCLSCRRMYRCQPGKTVVCKPCGGLQYTAPPSFEDVKRTQESKKFFKAIGLDGF